MKEYYFGYESFTISSLKNGDVLKNKAIIWLEYHFMD
jgi:hypothetical protein